jgi:predicted DNA binding CopG/RHH family protein
MKRKHRDVKEYDDNDTTGWINPSKPLSLKKLGLKLPPTAPTQVVSIRLPTSLLNRLRAIASNQDIPYQALIKLILAKSTKRLIPV